MKTSKTKTMSTKTNKLKGTLIVFEGIDGSGKSTQIKRIKKYIKKQFDRDVVVSSWKSAPIVSDYLRDLDKLDEQPSPLALSLIVAADLNERVQKEIVPALERGQVVICDRYTYTGLVRDKVVNNIDTAWLEGIYSFAPKPDMVFYFQVNDATSVERVDQRMQEGLARLVKKLRKKHGKVSEKKISKLIDKLKGSMTNGSTAGSMVDTIQALRKGERIYQVNGDPLTEEIAQQQRMELVNHLIAEYNTIAKKQHFVEVDAMKPISDVSWQIEQSLQGLLGKKA